jgi:hypothetical protein
MEMNLPYRMDNLTGAPLDHYLGKLKEADPTEIAVRTGLPFDGEKFALNVLGEQRTITFPAFDDEGWRDKDKILFARYLLEGKAVGTPTGFKTYRDMPWGEVYDTPFRGRCQMRLAGTFGTRPAAFAAACEKLGGTKLTSSALAYEICFMKDLYLQFYLWEGDEEFPASTQILFSDNFPDTFSAEDRVFVCEYILNRLR